MKEVNNTKNERGKKLDQKEEMPYRLVNGTKVYDHLVIKTKPVMIGEAISIKKINIKWLKNLFKK